MAFEVAIYTDVTRDESVDGTDGFTFQSVSPGLDGSDMRTIREQMLHQNSMRWPVDRDEREHPPTAAYLRGEGRFYFSRGEATGTTHNGRRGNQLTQAIVTADVEDLAPYRPAQVLAGHAWHLEKAPGQETPKLFAPLEIESCFDQEALIDGLLEDSWALEVLPAFLTMLEQTAGDSPRKVVIVHDDLAVVLRWFAVGSLLLSPEQALALEFRAFVPDPFQTRAALVGVHPDLHPGPFPGAYTIDLLQQTINDIEVSDAARAVAAWVQRLDVFDALEVTALGQRWIPILGAAVGAAGAEMVTQTRTVPVGREVWELGNSVIQGLAQNGLRDDLVAYVDEIAGAIGCYKLSGHDDFVEAARSSLFAQTVGVPVLAEETVAHSLECLLGEPESAGAWASTLLKDGAWQWPEGDDAERFPQQMVELAATTDDSSLPDVLRLMESLAPQPDQSTLNPTLKRVAELALQRPSIASEGFTGWYGAAALRRTLQERVAKELENPDTFGERWHQLRDGAWDAIAPTDISNASISTLPFLRWLAAARVARLPLEARAAALAGIPTGASHRADSLTPDTHMWKAVLQGSSLPRDIPLLETWIRLVGTDGPLVEVVHERLQLVAEGDPNGVRHRDVEAWLSLAKALTAREPGNERHQQLHQRFEELLEAIPTTRMDRMRHRGETMKNALGRFTNRER